MLKAEVKIWLKGTWVYGDFPLLMRSICSQAVRMTTLLSHCRHGSGFEAQQTHLVEEFSVHGGCCSSFDFRCQVNLSTKALHILFLGLALDQFLHGLVVTLLFCKVIDSCVVPPGQLVTPSCRITCLFSHFPAIVKGCKAVG